MKILEIKIMRGPNYWSNYRKKLIILKLDLEELEREPTHKIEGFLERLKNLLPSLSNHRCSEDHKGGFFERVQHGTWMGHVIEHIALEIQTLAGMEVGYGRTRSAKKQGVYHVVFAYKNEEAGKYAARAAVRIADALVKKEPYDITDDISYMNRLYRKQLFGPSTGTIVDAAVKKGIPYKRLDRNSLIIFGHGCKQKKIRATIADSTCGIGIEIAKDKDETKVLLETAHVPVPRGVLVYDEDDVLDYISEIDFPLVMKPYNGNHGRGITTGIQNKDEALEAFKVAARVSVPVIMEQFLQGDDYRLILVNYKLVAAAKRSPATITGNGHATIRQLIDQVNADPLRGEGHEKVLTKIKLDEISNSILEKNKLGPDSILPKGQTLALKHTANLSAGGTSEDVTDLVHPYNVFMAERVARLVNLDICGIDIVARDLSEPLTKNSGGIVEVNAGPGLRMHLQPSHGLPRNVAKPIIEMMFPGKENGRIPVIAITGTNGKTTCTRLLAHMADLAGHKVGYTTTEGIYIQKNKIYEGDCSGPKSAESVLLDPTIDFAVLECARGGILRSGLAFDESDISIVTNISEDHMGLKEIHTLEDMAKVKIVVPRTTKEEGYAILNADDDHVYAMHRQLDCRIALFSVDARNKRLRDHIDDGGIAAVIENGYLCIYDGEWKEQVEKIEQIPLSFKGRADSMIKNLLPVALAGYIRNFPMQIIRSALMSFTPSPTFSPGRMNIFHFGHFDLMIDYAHNVAGFVELKKFIDQTEASVKVGIIAVSGDRRDEDIRAIGKLSAQMFDEIIIRHDKDLRGRSQEEINDLLMEGIRESENLVPVQNISNELEALEYSIRSARENSFITVCADKIAESIAYLERALAVEKKRQRGVAQE